MKMPTLKMSALAITLSAVLSGCGFDDSPAKIHQPGPVLPGVPSGELAVKITKFRSNWTDFYVGAPAAKSSSELSGRIAALNTHVAKLLKENPMKTDGAFYTINTANKNSIGPSLLKNYQLLLDMTRAYKIPTGELAGDSELKATILRSLELLNQNYYHHNDITQHGNWWNWQIGIPKLANDILMLMGSEVDNALIGKYIATTRYFTPNATQITTSPGAQPIDASSANRADIAQVVLIRGILDANEGEIASALDAINQTVATLPSDNAVTGDDRDGFYADGSFIQHKDLPYTGSYGDVLIKSLGLIINSAHSSGFELNEQVNGIYAHLLNSYAPLLIDGRMMDFVNGRAISRESGQNHKIGHAILKSMLLHVEHAPEPQKSQLKSVIKTNINNDLYVNFFTAPLSLVESYQLAEQIVADDSVPIADPREQHIQFSDMDRIVHHRPTWTFGIAMHSNQVGNYECINNENKKGWFTADGMTYLYNGQLDHYTNYWATVDPYKLPGTTALTEEAAPRQDCDGQKSEQRDGRQDEIKWAGGAQLDAYGVVGFDFTNHNGSLTAKKSWFLFDDEIVAVGSDISDTTNSITTIENRKLSENSVITIDDPSYASDTENAEASIRFTVEGQVNPIQYFMLGGTTAKVAKETIAGTWSNIGTGSNAPISAEHFSAIIEHHNERDGQGAYQYIVVPDSDKSYDPDAINVEQADSIAHMVEHSTLGIIAANFWQTGNVGGINALTPMSFMAQGLTDPSVDVVKFAIAAPAQQSDSVKFKLDAPYTVSLDQSQRVSIAEDGTISINLSDLNGRSYSFSLRKE